MDKLLDRLFDIAWGSIPGRVVVLVVAALAGLVALWNSLPEPLQLELLGSAKRSLEPPSQIDIRIEPFEISDPEDQQLAWLKMKVERKLVEFYVDQDWKTHHKLTTREASGSAISPAPPTANYTISGEIRDDGRGRVSLSVDLRNEEGLALGNASFEQPPEFYDAVYRDFPEIIFFAMGLDPLSFKPATARPPTRHPAAYAYYLNARRLATQGDNEGASDALHLAIREDANFAMAYWALGQLSQAAGHTADADAHFLHAREIDPDHAKQPIFENVPSPLPTLLMKVRNTAWQQLDEGLFLQSIEVSDFDLTVYAIRFDGGRYAMQTAVQQEVFGNEVRDIVEAESAILGINGGFFEVDPADRLSPSGALYVGGLELAPYQERGGSGFLYDNGRELAIEWSSRIHSIDGILSGVQCGPVVVDPGGSNGIYSDDHDQRRRTAVCLNGNTATIVLVDGGLSLFDLGSLLSREAEQGGYECERAINLDGGPSSQLYLKHRGTELDVKGTWKANNAVLVVPRDNGKS